MADAARGSSSISPSALSAACWAAGSSRCWGSSPWERSEACSLRWPEPSCCCGSSRSSHPAAAKSAPTADTPAPALPANPPPAVSPLRRTARAEPTEGPPHRERNARHGLPRKRAVQSISAPKAKAGNLQKRSRSKPPRPESESREPLKTTAQSLPVPSAKADLRKRRKPAAEQRVFRLVELPGFEPGISEPKSDVLPLHHSSIRARKRRQRYAKNGKIQF